MQIGGGGYGGLDDEAGSSGFFVSESIFISRRNLNFSVTIGGGGSVSRDNLYSILKIKFSIQSSHIDGYPTIVVMDGQNFIIAQKYTANGGGG